MRPSSWQLDASRELIHDLVINILKIQTTGMHPEYECELSPAFNEATQGRKPTWTSPDQACCEELKMQGRCLILDVAAQRDSFSTAWKPL